MDSREQKILQENQRMLSLPVDSLTNFEIDRMTGDIYKERMRDPKFIEKVNQLEAARGPRPAR